jgi:hypothetical protein
MLKWADVKWVCGVCKKKCKRNICMEGKSL